MRKTITIGDKQVELKATAGTTKRYRNWFNRDLMIDFKEVQKQFKEGGEVSGETFEIIANLTYVMAKQADPSIPNQVEDWLDEFDVFPIADFAVDVVTFWASTIVTNVDLKNA